MKDGYLDFRRDSLKYRIYRYCHLRSNVWIHNGDIQREATYAGYEGSTTKRRIQEMIEEGYLKSRYNNKQLEIMYERN